MNDNRGKTCKVKDCNNKARIFGLCQYHYEQIYTTKEWHNGKRLYLRNLVIEG